MLMITARYKTLAWIAIGLLPVLSCSKSSNVNDNPPGETLLTVTTKRVQQKWNLDRFVNYETLGTQEFHDTIYGQAGDYFHFNTDNRAFSFWDGVYDTVSYLVVDPTHLKYGGDTFLIQTLTNAEFVLQRSGATDTSSFDHQLYLSK